MSGWLVGTSALTSGRSAPWGEETIRDEWGRARAAALSAISGGSTAVSGSPCTGAPRTGRVARVLGHDGGVSTLRRRLRSRC